MTGNSVYSTSESDGALRSVGAAVCKETFVNQSDIGNHNPRVGGSSPSSATIFQALSADAFEQFTRSCKLDDEIGASDRFEADLLAGLFHCPNTYPGLAELPKFVRPSGALYRLDRGEKLLAIYGTDGALIDVQGMYAGKVIYPVDSSAKRSFGPGRMERYSVYFVQAETGQIKIGIANDVRERLSTLRTASPLEIRLLAITTGGRSAERAYHQRFAAHRIRGEWFNPHPDILAEIDRLSTPHNRIKP